MDKTTYMNHARAWQYAEEHELARESALIKRARQQAVRHHLPQPPASQGTLLRTLAAMRQASSAIVIGTGALVAAAQLIEGLDGEGTLTAVDSSSMGTDQIRRFFANAQESTHTALRAVSANPVLFLPRLNANDYDLIVVSGEPSNYTTAFNMAPRLLHPNGAIVFTDIMAMSPAQDTGIFNSADRSHKTVAMRSLIASVEDDDRFSTAISPVGSGLMVAVLRA